MERKFDERSKSHLPLLVAFYVAMKMGAIVVPNVVSVENFGYLDIHIYGFVILQINIFDKMRVCDFFGGCCYFIILFHVDFHLVRHCLSYLLLANHLHFQFLSCGTVHGSCGTSEPLLQLQHRFTSLMLSGLLLVPVPFLHIYEGQETQSTPSTL